MFIREDLVATKYSVPMGPQLLLLTTKKTVLKTITTINMREILKRILKEENTKRNYEQIMIKIIKIKFKYT